MAELIKCPWALGHPLLEGGDHTVHFQTTEAVRDAWARLAGGGMDYHVVPGTHHSIFREPQVRNLAERLAACLDQAENGSTDGEIL